MSAFWRCFAVSNGYAGVSDHPRELLMHTGRKPGKSLSWVDTSLSLVETIMTGGAWGGMMSGGSV